MKRCAPVVKQRPDRLAKFLLLDALIAPIDEHLRRTGLQEREEAALIAGFIVGNDIGLGTTALLPHTENSMVSCAIPLDATIECVEAMRRAGQVLLAQAHSHPGSHIGHSDVDDGGAFSGCPGVFSIVVPQFGRYGLRHLLKKGAGIHERMMDGRWRVLPRAEVRNRFVIISSCLSIS